eukprot:TRINITY_DN91287_c0_g1_i1.p1 TRINITY_DN91287_c0_g1~~TRINITY_DN91287_c0_g1_i1.p1  ORF type:complete len:178 (-),score=49.59 TRINITY_DN91287_c0_g1_i1:10-543(-)
MSKYARFCGSSAALSGGFAASLTVAENDRLTTLLPSFKQWFADVEGFGGHLRSYFDQHADYFDLYAEEHALVYTELHDEFRRSLEESVDSWLRSQGLTEEAFGEMMQQALYRGDHESDEIVAVLLGMIDYQLWIASIFDLKRNAQVAALLAVSSEEAAANRSTMGYGEACRVGGYAL